MRSEKACSGNKHSAMPGRRSLYRACTVLLLVAAFWAPGWAFEDPLETAAFKSPLAQKSLLLDVALSGDRIVAVGERGHILYSDDNGQSWQQADVPVRVLLTSIVFPGGGKVGWAAGQSGVVLSSDDNGKTWIKRLDGRQIHQIAADAYETAVSELNAKLDAASVEDQDQLQTALEDMEIRHEDALSFVDDGPIRTLYDIKFINGRHGYAVGAFGLIIETRDGGKTWACPGPAIDNPDGNHYNSIIAADGILFLAGERGFCSRSLDDGESWETIQTPYLGSFFGGAGDAGGIMLVGLRGNAVISFNRGESWADVTTKENVTLSSAQVMGDGRILVSRYGKNLMISNADRTELKVLAWPAGKSISSFVLASDGSLITVGVDGVNRIIDPDFSAEVK